MKIDSPGTDPPLPAFVVLALRVRGADAAARGAAATERRELGALRARAGADFFSAGPEVGVRDFDLEPRCFVLSDMRPQNHPTSRRSRSTTGPTIMGSTFRLK
jgi:hypothetical protein